MVDFLFLAIICIYFLYYGSKIISIWFFFWDSQVLGGKDGINLQTSRSGIRFLQLNLKVSLLHIPKMKRQLFPVEEIKEWKSRMGLIQLW